MKKTIIRCVSFGLCLILVILLLGKHLQNKKTKGEEIFGGIYNVISNDEIVKKEYDTEYNRTKKFKCAISNDVELVVLTVTDDIKVENEKLANASKLRRFLFDSNILLDIRYEAVFAIKTENICVEYLDKPHISFENSNIYIKSLEITDIFVDKSKSIFGTEYTPEEVIAITNIAKDTVKETLKEDEMVKFLASQNLYDFLYLKTLEFRMFNATISVSD